jgi:hypothetical protein
LPVNWQLKAHVSTLINGLYGERIHVNWQLKASVSTPINGLHLERIQEGGWTHDRSNMRQLVFSSIKEPSWI